jgi:hypothetical protein
MAAHYSSIRDQVFQRFPYMRSSAFERRMLFQRRGERQFQHSSPDMMPAAAEPTSIVSRS